MRAPCAWPFVVISVALAGCNGSDNGGLIPLPELSGVEPLVRERILQRRQAVVETPSAETWLSYALALHAHEYRAEAEQAYLAAAADMKDERASRALHLCGVATRLNDKARARVHFLRALKWRTDYIPTHLNLAEIDEQLGNVEEAIRRYALVAKRSQSPHAELGWGRLLLRSGNAKEALLHLLKAQRLDPKLPAVHEALARAFTHLGRTAEGRAAAARAGDFGDARPFPDPFREALQQEEVHSGVNFGRGESLAERGRFKEAIVEMRAALAAQPDYSLTRIYLATVLAKDGQLDAARTELDLVLARNANDKDALRYRAQVFLDQNKRPEAERDLRALLRLDPTNAWAKKLLGH